VFPVGVRVDVVAVAEDVSQVGSLAVVAAVVCAPSDIADALVASVDVTVEAEEVVVGAAAGTGKAETAVVGRVEVVLSAVLEDCI
jgi:hypothetical protein